MIIVFFLPFSYVKFLQISDIRLTLILSRQEYARTAKPRDGSAGWLNMYGAELSPNGTDFL